MFGRSWNSAYSMAAATSNRSASPLSNDPSLVPCIAGGPAGVEAQHRDPCQRRKPERSLAHHVAVHHTAVGGQRVQADQRRDRVAVLGQRELADQGQIVRGVQRDRLAAGGQDGVRADGRHRAIVPDRTT